VIIFHGLYRSVGIELGDGEQGMGKLGSAQSSEVKPVHQETVASRRLQGGGQSIALLDRPTFLGTCGTPPLPPEEQRRHLVTVHHARSGIVDEIAGHPLALEAVARLLERRGRQAYCDQVTTVLARTDSLWRGPRGAEWERGYAEQLERNKSLVKEIFKHLPEFVATHHSFVLKLEEQIQGVGRRLAEIESTATADGGMHEAIAGLEARTKLPLTLLKQSLHRIQLFEKAAEESFELMVRSNLRLVAALATKVSPPRNRPVSVDDRFQRGTIGLIQALKRFDPSANASLATYAVPWILQGMRRLNLESPLVRVPPREVAMARSFSQTREKLGTQLGRPATEEEAAVVEELILPRVWRAQPRVISISAAPSGTDQGVLGLEIEDARLHGARHPVERSDVEAMITRVFDDDTPSLTVVRERFGRERRRLEDIAAGLGLTRERVRQLEVEALGVMTDFLIVRSATECHRHAVASRVLTPIGRAVVGNLFDDDHIPISQGEFVDEQGRPVSGRQQQRMLNTLATALVFVDAGEVRATALLAGASAHSSPRLALHPEEQTVFLTRLFGVDHSWYQIASLILEGRLEEQRRKSSRGGGVAGGVESAQKLDGWAEIEYVDDRRVQRLYRSASEKLCRLARARWRQNNSPA
jgi:RNA polymerase nonessential primary-like sigma factor